MSLENRLVPKGSEVDKLLDRYNLRLEVGNYVIQPKFNHIKILLVRINTREWDEIDSKYININLDKSDEEIQEYLVKEIKIFLTKQLLET